MLIVHSSIGLYLLRQNSKETENTLDSAEPAELTMGEDCSFNELNIQLFNFLPEKQDTKNRGDESY